MIDQVKIGKFIAEKRKEKGYTQFSLAEELNITDRAISKWENGRSMPDSSIMLELCEKLGLRVTEFLIGEVIDMKDYKEKTEETLIEMIKQKEEADKRLLTMEIVIGVIGVIFLFTLIAIASYFAMPDWLRFVLIVFGMIVFLIISKISFLS